MPSHLHTLLGTFFFPPAAINHSFTGGDAWSNKNIGRSFGADEPWLPQVFLELGTDL